LIARGPFAGGCQSCFPVVFLQTPSDNQIFCHDHSSFSTTMWLWRLVLLPVVMERPVPHRDRFRLHGAWQLGRACPAFFPAEQEIVKGHAP
tara:strand:- start:202 stop:474 length:273 start_codon:yes stop_codon:yes gene_type:complete